MVPLEDLLENCEVDCWLPTAVVLVLAACLGCFKYLLYLKSNKSYLTLIFYEICNCYNCDGIYQNSSTQVCDAMSVCGRVMFDVETGAKVKFTPMMRRWV